MRAKDFRPPSLSLRFAHVWRRNFLVWRKLAIPSMLGNLADPMLYMLGLGYGLGALVGKVGGLPYITFLAAGTVCYSTMNTATFEALYSAFSRMHVQRTWDAIMNAPINLDDVLLAEAVWAASKSFLSGCAILIIIWALGLSHAPLTLWIVPLAFLVGLTFACLGLVMNAASPVLLRRGDALDQVVSRHLHGHLVRGAVLPAAAVRLSRDERGPAEHRTFQDHGAQAVLRHHDAWRRIDLAVGRVVVAGIRLSRWLAGCQAGAGRGAGRLPSVFRQVDVRLQARP